MSLDSPSLSICGTVASFLCCALLGAVIWAAAALFDAAWSGVHR